MFGKVLDILNSAIILHLLLGLLKVYQNIIYLAIWKRSFNSEVDDILLHPRNIGLDGVMSHTILASTELKVFKVNLVFAIVSISIYQPPSLGYIFDMSLVLHLLYILIKVYERITRILSPQNILFFVILGFDFIDMSLASVTVDSAYPG